MKKTQRGFAAPELTVVLLIVLAIVGYVVNFVKLTNCDFAAPYRCEAIHGVGLIPFISPITVWFASDPKPPQPGA